MPATDLQLATELLTLRRENRRLRYGLNDRKTERRQARAVRLVDRSQRDAELLLTQHFAYLGTSRRAAPLGSRRWAMAVALLRLARLHDGRKITATDPARAMQKLVKAHRTATADPSMLYALVPASVRPDVLRNQNGSGND